MHLFYHSEIEGPGNYLLSDEESRHAIKVLRLEIDDELQLTNGQGLQVFAKVSSINKKQVGIYVDEVEEIKREVPALCIAISPIKSPARWEWFIEKATELGIETIIPILCTRTEKTGFKKDRLVNIMITAIKQSHRYFLPTLMPPLSFEEALQTNVPKKYIAHCNGFRSRKEFSSVDLTKDTIIFIGPEGDFVEEEVSKAEQEGFTSISLGKHRLRTETAGIICCQSFNFVNHL